MARVDLEYDAVAKNIASGLLYKCTDRVFVQSPFQGLPISRQNNRMIFLPSFSILLSMLIYTSSALKSKLDFKKRLLQIRAHHHRGSYNNSLDFERDLSLENTPLRKLPRVSTSRTIKYQGEKENKIQMRSLLQPLRLEKHKSQQFTESQ